MLIYCRVGILTKNILCQNFFGQPAPPCTIHINRPVHKFACKLVEEFCRSRSMDSGTVLLARGWAVVTKELGLNMLNEIRSDVQYRLG